MKSNEAVVGLVADWGAAIVVTAVGGRIVMRIIAITISFTLPRFSLDGTMFLAFAGLAFGAALGAAWGLLYMAVRNLLPLATPWKGLLFGILLLVITGGIFFGTDQAEDFADFQSPLLAVSLFAALYPIFGLVLAVFAAGLERALATRSPKQIKIIGYCVFGMLCLLGMLFNFSVISEFL